jgi:thiol:disulfide interchange protein DsbC
MKEKNLDRLTRMIIFPVMLFTLTLGGGTALPSSVKFQCPQKEKIQQGIQKTFPKLQFQIVQIAPTQVKGLCQIQIKIGPQHHLLYSDSRGNFLLTGNLHETASGKNLTQETVQLLNRLTPEELIQAESLTAFTLGQGKKIVYLVTDPQCPFCKQAESLIKKLIQQENLSVRFLFFPLDSHKGAKEQCISILCDNKGIEGFESGYRSDNQCSEGTKKVNNTITFLQKKGINSTPTFIFTDGIYQSGVPTEEVLRNRLGSPISKQR